MTTNPIYDQLVAEQKFNPAADSPIQTRAERARDHKVWQAKAEKKLTAPVRKPAKRAAS